MRNILKSNMDSDDSGPDFSKYLLYAIGELIIIVAGIIIAVRINDWSARMDDQREMAVILDEIIIDLQRDSAELVELVSYYDEKDSLTRQVIWRLVDREDFMKADIMNLVTTELSFKGNSNGYRHLLSNSGKLNEGDRALINGLTEVYDGYSRNIIVQISHQLTEFVNQVHVDWANQHEWYYDDSPVGRQACAEYQFSSPLYRNLARLYFDYSLHLRNHGRSNLSEVSDALNYCRSVRRNRR